MKSTTYILGLAVLALASCSSSKDAVYNGDGVYYNPKKHLEADKAVVVHPTTKLESTNSTSSSSQTNITNNYYGSGGYYGNDLYYSSRINRFYGNNYYPYYGGGCGTYSYGPTIYISSGWGYNNYSGCNSCGTFYQPYYSYNNFGGCHNNGYSYYNGYNGYGYNNYYGNYYGNNGWGGWNKKNYYQNPYQNVYNNNNTGGTYAGTKRYGPRTVSTNTNIPGNGNGNPVRPVVTSTAVAPSGNNVNIAADKPVIQKRAVVVNPVGNDSRETANSSGSTINTPAPAATRNDYESVPRNRPAQSMSAVEDKRNTVNVNRENSNTNTTINGNTERARNSEPVRSNSGNSGWSTPTYRGNTESVPSNNNNNNNNNYNIESTPSAPSTPSRSYEREPSSRPSYSPPAQQNTNNNSAPTRSSGGSSGGSSSGGSSSTPARRGPR